LSLHQRIDGTIKKYVYKGGLNGLIITIVFAVLLIFGCSVMLPVEVVKALLDVAAMLLGFFGVFVVYLLSYYDNRIDKLEKDVEHEKKKIVLNIYDKTEEEMTLERDTTISDVEKRLYRIKNKKGLIVDMSLVTFVCFMGSLSSSLVALGLLSTGSQGWLLYVIQVLSSATLAFLFSGILLVFTLIRRIGKEV
jgi:ABC-type multidrug transport system fused ATPase/permease subunit